jgi:alanine dehydrogenase
MQESAKIRWVTCSMDQCIYNEHTVLHYIVENLHALAVTPTRITADRLLNQPHCLDSHRLFSR